MDSPERRNLMEAVQNSKTQDIVYIGMFVVLIAICSWISIPTAVPFTLQTFGVFMAVETLGGKRGTMAVLVYILLGALGIPVFAGFSGGMGVLLGSTGGYIIGFILSALTIWGIENAFGNSKGVTAAAMLSGLLVCYLFGTVWFMTVYTRGGNQASLFTILTWCVFPFIIPDLAKIGMALFLAPRIRRAADIR